MAKVGKTGVATSDEAEQMLAFVKNVKKADAIRDKYQGNFVAICRQEVVGHDPEHRNLLNSIDPAIKNEKELYVGYVPKIEEVLMV